MKKLISILLTLAFVVTGLSITIFADAENTDLKFEGESTPFSVTDSEGVTATESNASKWAFTMALKGASNVSGTLPYFRSGGIGGTVTYEIQLEQAGDFDVFWAYRPNSDSYSTVQVYVNGTALGTPVSQKGGDTVGGAVNVENTVREVSLGRASFTAGKNTVTFELVAAGPSEKNTAFTVDYIRLSASEEEEPAFELPYRIEAESTPFSVTDANGKTTTNDTSATDWKWTLKLNGYDDQKSGQLAFFRSGGIGGTVDYTVTIPEAGNYGITWRMRSYYDTYATVQVLVNGEEVGGLISQKAGLTVGGKVNAENGLRSVVLGNADFAKGENIVTFKLVGARDDGDMAKTGFVIDYIELTEPVDESTLTFTEFPDLDPDTDPDPDPDTDPVFTLPIRIEAESTPFSVTDANGKTTSDDPSATDWKWTLKLGGYEDTKSGQLAFFRSGGIGATVNYTVDIAKAGNYGITWRMRSHNESYAVVQVLVNGKEVGGLISQKAGLTVGGKVNAENGLRSVVLGNADFVEGENIITFKLVAARDDGNMEKTGFVIDYIDITEPVDESTLTFTEFPQPDTPVETAPATGDPLWLVAVPLMVTLGGCILYTRRRRTV
ncbi:MAG: hypothetical protein ACI3YH_06680 [Eubacteriales bacterium]